MTFRMKKRLCILLIGILLLLALIPFLYFRKIQPKGSYITVTEVQVLTRLLDEVTALTDTENAGMEATVETVQLNTNSHRERIAELQALANGWEAGNLTYGQFLSWYALASDDFVRLPAEEEERLAGLYKKEFFFLKEDWYLYFDLICAELDPEEELIISRDLLVLGDSSNVKDVEGTPLEAGKVFTNNGSWFEELPAAYIPLQCRSAFVTYNGAIWGVRTTEEEAVLQNVWVVENTEEEFKYFYKNYEMTLMKEDEDTKAEELSIEEIESSEKGLTEAEDLKNSSNQGRTTKITYQGREQVADLTFTQGSLTEVSEKTEKLSGKVLKISAEEVEIDGLGSFPLAEEMQLYRLYDRLEAVGRSEVRLGYDFTDFVMEDGKVQAALLVKDEKMDNIRVLLKNSGYDSYYHDEVVGKSDVDLELYYGDEVLTIPAGETFHIYADSEYFTKNRIFLRPTVLTGRTYLSSIERNNGGQGYYGNFELEKREEGIVIINEVLLEKYLYAVVPSEMPAYYPQEALQAQAICARTYAYRKMESSALNSYGANLDDSSTYQVYNNIKENSETTKAVNATRDELLYAGEKLADTYYYSTSCGFGTTAAIWNSEGENQLPYLQAREMTESGTSYTGEQLRQEEVFADFITSTDESHFEAEESWYRWTYEHSAMEKVAEKLTGRLENYPNYVYTSTDGKKWGHTPLEADFIIEDIAVRSRGEGGTIEELLVTTDKGYFLVKNEYHIRAVLTDGEAVVYLQKGNTYACGNLLPSAFFILELEKENSTVIGIKLTGGGFGHGVGMSQNGAKNLANAGRNAAEILEFYYADCSVK